tara:strand:- start:872 stop:1906 length:1035 start_codon:yes stop_codon:yes gene_type:complete
MGGKMDIRKNLISKVTVNDTTLRDGSHANSHKFSKKQIEDYCQLANKANISIVEIGHGNGLGASSLQLGQSSITDREMIKSARKHLTTSKLGVHVIPGFATIEKDIKPAIDAGVDIFRVASHCTEADLCEKHISYVRQSGLEVWGCLMMSHMLSPELLAEQAKKMKDYGAEGVIFMDSAGAYLPEDVATRVEALLSEISIGVGFHAHNNLGMAVINSITAVKTGAILVDGSVRGFGAGSGNAQLEVLVAVLEKIKISTGVKLYSLLDLAEYAEEFIINEFPKIKSESIVSGLAGVFSGFIKPVLRIAKETGADPRDIFFELGKKKVIAGQEDMILEIAKNLIGK